MSNIKSIYESSPKGKNKRQKNHPDVTCNWISIEDVKSRKETKDSRRLQLENFNNLSEANTEYSFFSLFKSHNNRLINLAREVGVFDLGDAYDLFFKEGFRVSQQLNGKLRDICREKYYGYLQDTFNSLETETIRAFDNSKQEQHKQLDGILEVSQNLDKEDLDSITEVVEGLKSKKIELPLIKYDLKTIVGNIRGIDDYDVNGIFSQLNSDFLGIRICMGKNVEKYKSLSESLGNIADSLKAKALKIFTYNYSEYGGSDFEGYTGIFDNLNKLDEKQACIYLDFLDQMALNTEEDNKTYGSINEWIDVANFEDYAGPNNFNYYLSAISKLLNEGIYDGINFIAEETLALSIVAGNEKADEILSKSISMYNESGNEFRIGDYLESVRQNEFNNDSDVFKIIYDNKK